MALDKTPTDIMMELANRVRTLRLNRRWSRQDLADASGVNIFTLKRFERTGFISFDRLLSLCDVLGYLHEFERLLKPRARIDVDAWQVPDKPTRQRGRRREAEDENLIEETEPV